MPTNIEESPVDARRKANWARLIQKVYEIDPLECSNCGATMRINALIDDAHVSAWAYYPNMLISPTNAEFNLTIYNSAASPYALQVGFYWFIPAIALITAYTVYMHRSFWGKVPVPEEGQKH